MRLSASIASVEKDPGARRCFARRQNGTVTRLGSGAPKRGQRAIHPPHTGNT